jgi:hypothetical protein
MAIGNLKIDNPETHPLPRGGTDLMGRIMNDWKHAAASHPS